MRHTIVALFVGLALCTDASLQDDDWLSFPTRRGSILIHKDCVHRADDGDFEEVTEPCPFAPRHPALLTQSTQDNSTLAAIHYYSDWVAYTVTTGDFGYMSTDWVVPPAPTTHGPVPGMSSTYFFNGLEDGGGVHGEANYILQPVLSYGKSGCIINPVNFFRWYLISFSVTGAGRAFCGKRIAVREGEKVRGIMQLEKDGTSWSTISIRLKNNDTSIAKTNLTGNQPNAAYVTLETMINYACSSFPKGGSITFEKSVLKDRQGKDLKAEWKPMIRHTECNQKVKINDDTSVTLTWDDGESKSIVV